MSGKRKSYGQLGDGTPVTDDLVAALASVATEPPAAELRRVGTTPTGRSLYTRGSSGRPALAPGAGQSPVLQVRLEADLRAKIDQLAAESDQSVSEFVRGLLRAAVG